MTTHPFKDRRPILLAAILALLSAAPVSRAADASAPAESRFQIPATDDGLAGQRSGSLICEIYVPHDAAAGIHHDVLRL